jgi:outer membrane immunogenic protein
MKRKLIAAAIALVSFPAFAADMPLKARPAIAPAPFSWTGFYLGGNVGYGWGHADGGTVSFFQPIGTLAGTIPGNSIDTNGVIGGGEIGFNQQLGNWVLGIEGDFSGTGMKGSITNTALSYTAHSEIDWLATVRGRLGVAFDRTLVYGTGGLAVGSVKSTLDDTYPGPVVITTSSTNTHVGWTAGAGVATMLTQSWSVKLEYLHVDLGSKQYNHNEPSPPGWPLISYNASVTADVVRGGFDFKL